MAFCIGPNLFVDDYLIAESRGLKRTTHRPQRHPHPVFHVTPGDVTYDPDAGKFRMRYIEDGQYAVAESSDGMDWKKPILGLVEENGNIRNNYLLAPKGGFQGQFFDDGPGASDPARRYKLAFFRLNAGLCLAFSLDGLRYLEFAGNPVIPENANDIPVGQPGSQSIISDIIKGCWDPLTRKYLIICKVWEGGYPGKPHHAPEGYRRVVGMASSKDFVTWDKPRIILRPDPANGLEEFYGFAPVVRGNLYIGLLCVLRDDLPARAGGPVEGIGWTELVTSRDGRNWTRHPEKFLDRDPREGQSDHAFAYARSAVTVGDREYIYYASFLSGHKTDRERGRKTGLAVLRKDGFVSRDAGPEGGLLKTSPAVLPGKRLTVNALVRGELRVRLVDPDGKTLRGYDSADCLAVRGDSVVHRIAWRENDVVPRGDVAALEFMLEDAQFYGFDYSDQ